MVEHEYRHKSRMMHATNGMHPDIFGTNNDFVKPKDKRELTPFDLARDCTFKGIFFNLFIIFILQ